MCEWQVVTKECLFSFLSFVALQYRSPWRRRFATICVCPDDRFLSSAEERTPSACLSRIMGIKLFLLIYQRLILLQLHNPVCIISKSENLTRTDMNLFILVVWTFIPFCWNINVFVYKMLPYTLLRRTFLDWKKLLICKTHMILRVSNKRMWTCIKFYHLVHTFFGYSFIIWYLNLIHITSR